MKEKVCECVAEVLKVVSCEEVLQMMEIPPGESMGDFALPCFGFAKIMHKNPKVIAEVSEGLGEAMSGIDVRQLPEHEQYAKRGW